MESSPFSFSEKNMPWKAFKTDNEWCVFKLDSNGDKTGSSLGCHVTLELANRQVAALNIQENKEEEQEEKALLAGIEHEGVPVPVTSFADLDAMNEAQELVGDMKQLTGQFAEMAENIFLNSEIEDKAQALQTLAGEFATRLSDVTKEETKEVDSDSLAQKLGISDLIKSLFHRPVESVPDNVKEVDSFVVWENKETGEWRWLSIYSNKYRDNDRPPEIISEASHKSFIERVENKEADYPELWLWHVPGTRAGQSDWLAYTDEGFALASGIFDEGKEQIAKNLSEMDDLLVSHGMLKSSIKRDEEDPTIIVEHNTREVSPLPSEAAANKLTSFKLLSKEESSMGIPENKLPFLKAAGLSDDEIASLEAGVKEKAEEAEGLDFKEEDTTEDENKKEEKPTVNDDMTKAISGLVQAVKSLQGMVTELQAEVKQLKKEDDEKVADKAASVPHASLEALVQESLFGKQTEVDGRTKLAKDTPKQADAELDGQPFFAEWLKPQTQVMEVRSGN